MEREDEIENESVGRVTYRRREIHSASSVPGTRTESKKTYEYSFTPLRNENATQSPKTKRAASPLSNQDLLPPDLGVSSDGATESGFKNWLTTGILDVLGTAAGVTLSTTGKLVAPPLHMTKTLILPGLLALFVDTLDAITPPRVQDWFRILSSSVHHLIVVLGSTEKGKLFSTQVYIVLQDILQALSAPESRQVVVDGMATSVKFAAALNTPEMKEFLEQLSTLGIRLLDAASSGKAKQLMQDTKELTWKGIEMAADPATTLALAEVTAHICHALEDTQRVLNPTPRKQRNAQNQNVYLNPCQMADFPEQVTMEEVILSCLGCVDEQRRENVGDDTASLPSRLTLDDDLSTAEPEFRDWRERKDQVNVQLLREKILDVGIPKRGTKRATTSPYQERESGEKTLGGSPLKDPAVSTTEQRQLTEQTQEGDMEDITWSCVPGGRRLGLKEGDKRITSLDGLPAIQQFYSRLDELLEQDRLRPGSVRTRLESTINNLLDKDELDSNPWGVFKARITKLQREQISKSSRTTTANVKQSAKKSQLPLLLVLFMGTFLFLAFGGFAMYGIYSLVVGHTSPVHVSPPSANQEIIIRIVREIVHVSENGNVIGESITQVLSPEELDEVGRNIATIFR